VKLLIESVAQLKGKTLEGVALSPTVSLNGNIYSIEEIERIQGLNIPLIADWEHTDERVGSVVYELKGSTVFYKITMESESRMKELVDSNGIYRVSIEADVNNVVESCSKLRCYNLLEGITLSGIGVTKNPGVQSTTLNIIESKQEWPVIEKNCKKCMIRENDELEALKKENAELKTKLKCEKCGKIKP
jgi:hypothetical protein